MDKRVDYIGAPTLEGMLKPYRAEKVLFTQNGGLSLRKTSAFIDWTRENKKEITLMLKYDDEDSIIYALRHKGINMLPADEALRFSFDSNVKECFRRTKGKLPFGCHAWERYAFDVWKPIIEAQGYKVKEVSESRAIVKDYYYITNNNRLWIENYDSTMVKEALNSLFGRIIESVYVWGMGKLGYEVMQLLLGAGINIVAFLDKDTEKIREGMYPCIGMAIDDALHNREEIPIIVAMKKHVDVCIYLEHQNLYHYKDYITYTELYSEFEKRLLSKF